MVSITVMRPPDASQIIQKLPKLPTKWLTAACLSVTVLLVLPAAYQNTVVDQPQTLIEHDFLNRSFFRQRHYYLRDEQLNLLWGSITCISGLAAIPCSILMPYLVDIFGVKNVLFFFGSVCNLLCPILECIAKYTGIWELLLVGQIFGPGFGWTFAFGLAPVYLSECSPSHQRGMTGTMVSFGFYVGILLAFIIGINPLLGNSKLWGIYVVLTAVPAVLGVVACCVFPDSPKHLYMEEEDVEEAKKVMGLFYGPEAFSTKIFEEFDDEANLTSVHFTLREMWRESHLRAGLLVSVVAQIFAFCSGPMVYMTYSASIFSLVLQPDEDGFKGQMATIAMAAPLPFLAIAASYVMEKFGRRSLLLSCGVAMQLSNLIYILFGAASQYTNTRTLGYIAASGVVLNFWISPFGPVAIGLFFMSEIMPQAARTTASGVCVIFGMITYAILNFTYPYVEGKIGYWTPLVLLIPPSTLCLIFLWLKMPETLGEPVNEVVNKWITPEHKEKITTIRKLTQMHKGHKESLSGGRRVSIAEQLARQGIAHLNNAEIEQAIEKLATDRQGTESSTQTQRNGSTSTAVELEPGAEAVRFGRKRGSQVLAMPMLAMLTNSNGHCASGDLSPVVEGVERTSTFY